MKDPKKAFAEAASKLSQKERMRILSRMRPKLSSHFLDGKVTEDQAIAVQLEKEAKALTEWQQKLDEMRKGGR